MTTNGNKWKEDLCYSTPTYYEHPVNKKTQKFYPVSVGLLFELKRTAANAGKAISTIFATTVNDKKTIDSTETNPSGAMQRTVVIEPVELGIIKFRDEQRANAWANTLDAFTDKETLNLIANIIMDSMQEVFPRDGDGNINGPTPEEFLKATKLPTLVQMVVGVVKGNKDVLGPLASKVNSFLSDLEKVALTKIEEFTKEKTEAQAPPAS